MANLIRLKRASGSDPTASDLVSGEPAVRTDTGELFFKKDDGSVAKVSGAGGGPDFKYLALRNAANNGAASYPAADFTLVTSGTTTAITPTAANTLLVSVNGVIQKPNTGTSTSGITGFIVDGSRFKTATNLSAAPDFILYQESGGIGEPSNNTVSEAKLNVSNSPVNGYFLSAQSGNTGGLTWAAPVATSCTGNSATATALATARAINGVNFDGTAAITVTAAASTLSGNTLNSSVTASSLTSLGDLSGLTVTGNMAVDTSTLFVNASTNRVGIGTSNPGQLLDVVAASGDASFRVRTLGTGSGDDTVIRCLVNTTTSSNYIQFGDTGDVNAGQIRYQHSNNSLQFTTNASEAMRIDSSGKVLIGTTVARSPGSLIPNLQIEGTDVNTSSISLTRNSANSGCPSITFNKTRGTSVGSDTIVQSGDTLGIIQFVGNDGTDSDTPAAWIAAKVDGTPGSDDMPGRLEFYTTADGANTVTERMRINSSGNVGIGTSSPSQKLHVSGSAPEILLEHTGGNDMTLTTSDGMGMNGITVNGGFLSLAYNNKNVVMCRTGGSVGIGTTSPAGQLHVSSGASGDCKLIIEADTDNNDENDNPLIVFRQDGGIEESAIGMGFTSTSSDNILTLANSVTNGAITFATGTTNGYTNAVERMRITSGGALLIGTTSTGYYSNDLVLAAGNGGGMTIAASSTSDTNFINFADAANSGGYLMGGILYQHSTNVLAFRANNAERMRIDSSGNLGINQDNPSRARLHVVGDNNDGDIIAKFKSGSNNANSTAFIALVTGYPDDANDYEGHAYIGVQRSGATNNTKILFKTYSGDSGGAMRTRMTIEPNNNIDIQGKIHTQLGTQINSFNKETTGDQIRFNTTGTTRGSISSNGSTVAFNTSASDRSMKKNFENWTEDTLNLFKNINPQRFNFLDQEDGTNKEKGFIAQDMVASFPEAYIKNDDDKYMFNASGMVVYLMKAVQELTAKVEALEAG